MANRHTRHSKHNSGVTIRPASGRSLASVLAEYRATHPTPSTPEAASSGASAPDIKAPQAPQLTVTERAARAKQIGETYRLGEKSSETVANFPWAERLLDQVKAVPHADARVFHVRYREKTRDGNHRLGFEIRSPRAMHDFALISMTEAGDFQIHAQPRSSILQSVLTHMKPSEPASADRSRLIRKPNIDPGRGP